MEEDQASRQEEVWVEDSRPEEEVVGEHLLMASEELQESQALVGEGGSQNQALEVAGVDH